MAYRRPIRVQPMVSADSVIYALRTAGSPEYIHAVIKSYVEIKVARGKYKTEIGHKLDLLEMELPQHAQHFRAVRREAGLPESRVLPGGQLDRTIRRTASNTTGASSLSVRPTGIIRATTSTATRRPSTSTVASTATAPAPSVTRPAIVRPVQEDDEDPPPPPYTSADPEPDSTRLLQERLAAEAESRGAIQTDPPQSARSASSPPATASSSHHQQQYAPPPNPPPGASQPASSSPSNRQPPVREDSTPQRVPSDEELRRVWEESQFDEAKRESRAAEQERKDLEEALRLSLQEGEASGSGTTGQYDQYGSSSGPSQSGPSFQFHDEDPASRRVSSYNPITRRDSTFDQDRPTHIPEYGEASTAGITQGLNDLRMPGGFDGPAVPQPPSSGFHAQSTNQQSLLDDDDDSQNLSSAGPMLTPMKTGMAMQSKNPFLSPHEVQQEEGPSTPPPTIDQKSFPSPRSEFPPSTSSPLPQLSVNNTRDSPGSAKTTHTIYNQDAQHGLSPSPRIPSGSSPTPRALPRPPSTSRPPVESSFTPPPGPPPAPMSPQQPMQQYPHQPPYQQQQPPQQQAQTPKQQFQQYIQSITPALPPRRDTHAPHVVNQEVQSPGVYSPQYPSSTQYQSNQQSAPLNPQSYPKPQGSAQKNTPSYSYSQSGQIPDSMYEVSSPMSAYPQQNQLFEQAQFPAAAPSSGPALARSLSTVVDGEDPLDMLKQYDTVFLIDDSASMAGERWEQARSALIGVADIAAQYDDDGVDVYFLNSKRVGKELRTEADVEDLFAGLVPKGATPTGQRLETILREYMARLERQTISSTNETPSQGEGFVKPMNLIVITDGGVFRGGVSKDEIDNQGAAPTDDPESVIIATAKRLDRGDYPLSQVGIQFMQVGDDLEARQALQSMDDELSHTHGVRDMVDTVPYTGEEMSAGLIIKTLMGGINRRLDRRG